MYNAMMRALAKKSRPELESREVGLLAITHPMNASTSDVFKSEQM